MDIREKSKDKYSLIGSLLELSDFRQVGLGLTLQKAFAEVFYRENIRRNKKRKSRFARAIWDKYTQKRDKAFGNILESVALIGNKDKVSVVIPVLQEDSYFADTLESVLRQKESSFEVIVVIDERAEAAVFSLAEKDDRIRILSGRFENSTQALNEGLALSEGEFVVPLKCGDVPEPEPLEKLRLFLNENPKTAMVSENTAGKANLFQSDGQLNMTSGTAMYRRSALLICGGFSSGELWEYDTQLKINCLFQTGRIENPHGGLSESCLIEKSSKHREVYIGFLRDFFLSELVWVVETEKEQNSAYVEFKDAAKAAGHICLSVSDARKCRADGDFSDFCHIYFGSGEEYRKRSRKENYSARVLVSEEACHSCGADVLLTTYVGNLQKAEDFKGWFYVSKGEDIFRLADAKVKCLMLEKRKNKREYEKKLSAVLCTYRRGEKLGDTLNSLMNQSLRREDYEIIVVDNSPFEGDCREIFEKYRTLSAGEEGFLRYVGVPRKGLSHARNVGAEKAKGEYLLFVDDDAVADFHIAESICRAFDEHPDAGIVGGQIILEIPESAKELVRRGNENIWSQRLIKGDKYRETKRPYEFPFGANLGIRSCALADLGGFRLEYGRVGKDFGGGEETVLVFQMLKLGYKVGLEPKAKVIHRVDEDRFSREHIRKTIRSGVFNYHRFFTDLHSDMGWTEKYVRKQIKIVKKEVEFLKRKNAKTIDIFYKECYLETWKELLEQMESEK